MSEIPEYQTTCSDKCLLKHRKDVNDALASGLSYNKIIASMAGTNKSNLSRHRRHVLVVGAPEPTAPATRTSDRVPHVQVLEAIIAAGWENRAKWRPTIGDTMKAMDMYQKHTQGSAFQDLLDALASDISDEEDEYQPPENPEALVERNDGG